MSCARTGVFGARAFVGRARAGATTAGTSRSTRAGSASGDEGADAEARGYADPIGRPRRHGQLGNRDAQALRQRFGALEIRFGKEQGELLSPETRAQVDLARASLEHFGEGFEEVVANAVAEQIVDALEVIEVGDDQGQRALEPFGAAELESKCFCERAAIRKPCQLVRNGLSLDDAVKERILERDRRLRCERMSQGRRPLVEAPDPCIEK